MILSGWGRYPRLDCEARLARDEEGLRRTLAAAADTGRPLIARGNGRSYGDSALQPLGTVGMRAMNHILGFDPATGIVTAEAGVLLDDLIAVFLPQGWFPWVTPGTRFVTVGGMIASDVHGKNHHRDGSFGNFVAWIDVMGPDGAVRRCAPDDEAGLFAATVGGMGLSGVILRAAFRLRPVETGWIRQRTIPTAGLDATIAAFEANADATYSVAWIDCMATGAALGRSLLTLGEHAHMGELPEEARARPLTLDLARKRKVPLDAPGFALNRWSVSAFNALYYRRGAAQAGSALVPWDSYFYPLDALLEWNRIYGRRGFAQYQCVLPLEASAEGLRALLTEISASGRSSFLTVLKRMGPEGLGRIGFPMEGYTLALDFPMSAGTLGLLRRLDEIVLAHGGRFYLAKDSRIAADTLRRADPRAADFRTLREEAGLSGRFASAQSERLIL